jgi:RNase adapter protein RapZ
MKRVTARTSAKSPARKSAPLANLVVTGMSGAGRSSALRWLEDLGFEAMDNLPLSLLQPMLARRGPARAPIAVGVDARTADFDPVRLGRIVARQRSRRAAPLKLLFLDASDETLARRYRETRRKHPLGANRSVAAAIRSERALLKPLRASADEVIDTTDLSPPHLRRLLKSRFGAAGAAMSASVVSFAYRRGLPAEADLVFDVRFLDNPHYKAALRPLDGRHAKIAAYVARDPGFSKFFKTLTDLLAILLPRFEDEGKSDVTIAIGCTGGRHRSVYVTERLAHWLTTRGLAVTVRHRDLSTGKEAKGEQELASGGPRRRRSSRRGKVS